MRGSASEVPCCCSLCRPGQKEAAWPGRTGLDCSPEATALSQQPSPWPFPKVPRTGLPGLGISTICQAACPGRA